MKKNYLLTILSLIFCLAFHYTNAQFVFADDNATNSYTSPLNNGNTGGSGFFPWDINAGAATGAFIGDPANDGMGTTNIGTTAWGFYANGNAYINAQRYFDNIGMEVGDEFTFDWAMNFDAGGGAKGFDFKKDGGNTVFNINNGDSEVIDGENGNIDANYGTTPMSVTLKRISSSDYSFSMTSRSGGATYTTTYTSTETIKGINIYSGNQNNNDGRKNIYFNNFLLQNSGAFDIIGGSESYTKDLTGSTAVSKSGVGTLTLSGNNTYTGTTTVSAGTLVLNSSVASSAFTVNSGATLQISSDATISSLVINAGGMVTVDSGITLTISNDLTLNSDSSMVVEGSLSLTGNVTFNRNLANGSQWYLMSAPVTGETYDAAWAAANSIPTSNLDTDNIGISTYDNSSADTDDDGAGSDTATEHWSYLQTDDSNSGNFNVGQGYGIIRSSSADIFFTGTGIYTATQTIPLTLGVNNYNLVGNPFTASLNLGDFFADNGVGVISGAQTWFWNSSTSSYDNKLSGDDGNYEIAPGQGFFVDAATATNLTFDIEDVSHTSATFQKTVPRTEITLNLTEGANTRNAYIRYSNGTTKGYDLGYDGNLFGGVSHSLAIYSHLVDNDQGEKYQVQSLPNSDLESMVIPVGIIADAGEITFSAETVNFPSELKVFLEDRQNNIFTRLDEANSSYAVTLTEKTDGIGRFYLHTNSSALSTDNVQLENISIYKANTSTLRIVGLSQGKANLKLFNILGEQVLNRNFTSNGVYDVSLPQLATGVYIAQLENENGKINKKIVLE